MPQVNQVVTVTINPAIDQTIAIPGFSAGAVNRVQHSRLDPGGKGNNVAAFLTDYGLQVAATGFLGAENDEIFRRFFDSRGIVDRCIRIPGETRIGVKIIDEVARQTTDINFPGIAARPFDIEQLFNLLRGLDSGNPWFVLAGSIPAGVSAGIYHEMVSILAGKKVAVDTSGEGLAQAVTAGPWLIKPNRFELQELVKQRLETPGEILRAARDLMQRHEIAIVVVSMGKEGVILVEGTEAVRAIPPVVEVKSTVGAGDAVLAGIIAGKISGLSLAECARLGTAFSMIAITNIGAGLPSLEAVESWKREVTVHDAEDDRATHHR